MRLRTFPLLMLLAAALLCWRPSAVRAREGWTVESVKVEGLPPDVDGVTRGLGLSARSGLLGAGQTVYREAVLRADLQRLRLLLARHGYPYARIAHTVTPDARGRRVDVVFTVSPGRPVVLAGARVVGTPVELDRLPVLAARALPDGRVFTDAGAQAARDLLAGALARAGYALCEVRMQVERPDSFTASPVFTVVPGERQRIAQVSVEGVPEDLVPLAVRSMSVPAGILYSPDLLDRARENLRELRLFRQIRVATSPLGPGELLLVADLEAAAPRNARVSVGTWSDDPIRLSASWQHRNLFRRGRGLGFSGDYSPYYRELDGRVWWPALLGPRSVVELRASWFEEDEDSYRLVNSLLESSVLLRPVGRFSIRFGASLENVTVTGTGLDRTAFAGPDGRQLVLTARLYDDRADHLLYPTRGFRLGLDTAWSPPGDWSAAPFVSVEGRLVGYLPLPGGTVLASRVAAGVAQPLGGAESLLPNHRFFAGGVTTMRGYRRRRLGPVDGDDDPVGGQARLLASTELRVPLTGWLEAAAFVDAGQVWADRAGFGFDGLDVAAGGGLVFHTPVGPVRTDLAHLLDAPRAGEPRNVFHLAIGHPF